MTHKTPLQLQLLGRTHSRKHHLVVPGHLYSQPFYIEPDVHRANAEKPIIHRLGETLYDPLGFLPCDIYVKAHKEVELRDMERWRAYAHSHVDYQIQGLARMYARLLCRREVHTGLLHDNTIFEFGWKRYYATLRKRP